MKFNVLILLLNAVLLAHSLPIFSSMSISFNDKDNHEATLKDESKLHNQNERSNDITEATIPESDVTMLPPQANEEEEDGCPDTNFPIPEERFAQLVSTHWQFDHLDSIKSGTYKLISEQFQKHITISIEEKADQLEQDTPNNNNRQKSFRSLRSSSWDMMDMEILQAQISGAIQAHTEGSLHLAWDRLADKLGQPAFDVYIRSIASQFCSYSSDTSAMISSTCLKKNANKLSAEMDNYIKENLIQVFETLDTDILPQLLSNTSKDLFDVLNYFNRLFSLGENQQLSLQVTPWQPQVENLKSTLLSLLDTSILNDDHLIDFFSNYACLSRV